MGSVSLATRRDDFADDEWGLLSAAPRIAGALIVLSDLHLTGMLGEFKALAVALTDRNADGADNELVRSLIDGMGAAADDDDDVPPAVALLQGAAALADAKATVDEAAGDRRWVLAAVRATAEARTESAVFGIGGERVSDDERAASADIAAALGVAGLD
ncbi:hypothetical protein [Ilumatobacter sp.]|uniref:hypothetical protein n=1 Tax=Ilumatobacter sp. TaxID=1967498 RepID=UPI003AF7EFED